MSPIKLNFLLFLLQCAESSSTSNSFYTSTDDSQNTSYDENLELTSTPNEKGKSPKDFCIMDEAIELAIVKVSSLGLGGWMVKSTLSIPYFLFYRKGKTQGANWKT